MVEAWLPIHTHGTHTACMHLPQCVCVCVHSTISYKGNWMRLFTLVHAIMLISRDWWTRSFITLHMITRVTTNALQNTFSGRCPFLFIIIALGQPFISLKFCIVLNELIRSVLIWVICQPLIFLFVGIFCTSILVARWWNHQVLLIGYFCIYRNGKASTCLKEENG